MKKLLLLVLSFAFVVPALAITEPTEVQKAEIKYQRKLEKIKRKQEIWKKLRKTKKLNVLKRLKNAQWQLQFNKQRLLLVLHSKG